MIARSTSLFLLLLLIVSCSVPTLAQETPTATPAPAPVGPTPIAPTPIGPTPLPELRSPKATLQTFLRAMREKEIPLAVSCLDLGNLTSEATATGGPNVAYQLHVVIQRLTSLTLEEASLWENVPDENTHEVAFSLDAIPNANRDAIAVVLRRNKEFNWQFTEETCANIETLYNALEQLTVPDDEVGEKIDQPFTIRLRNLFPIRLRDKTFLLPDYQWLCLIALIFVGLTADLITRWLLALVSSRWLDRYVEEEELAARAKIWRPLGRLVNAATWYGGTKLIGLPPSTLHLLLIGLKLFTIYAATWTAFAMIDVTAKFLARQALRTDTKFDDLLVPLVSKSLKIFSVCVAVLTAAQTFDIPVLGLVGGLGLGGAALAFASKDAVSNFFGSVTVLFDRPFEVGDWIVTEGAEGTVETVGFRSTRVRTFYNSLVTLPNSRLTTAAVDNMGRRRYRRIKTTLGLQYNTTPDQLEAFCEGVRELIRLHPSTRKDYFHVYFNDFGASSLDVMLYCFVECPDWSAELQARHRLLADIIRLAEKLGVQFAFPTRTLHMATETSEGSPPLNDPENLGKQFAGEIASDKPN